MNIVNLIYFQYVHLNQIHDPYQNIVSPVEEKPGIVYKIKYTGWFGQFIPMLEKQEEHWKVDRKKEHALDTGHNIGCDDAHIIDFETHFWGLFHNTCYL